MTFSWAIGVAMYFALSEKPENRLKNRYNALLSVFFLVLALVRVTYVHRRQTLDYDPMYSALLLFCMFFAIRFCQQAKPISTTWLCKAARFVSSYSFSIYVTHYSVMVLFQILMRDQKKTLLSLALLVLACNLVAIPFAMIFEKLLPKWIAGLVDRIQLVAQARRKAVDAPRP